MVRVDNIGNKVSKLNIYKLFNTIYNKGDDSKNSGLGDRFSGWTRWTR